MVNCRFVNVMRRQLAGNTYCNSLTHLEYMASMEHVIDKRQRGRQTNGQTSRVHCIACSKGVPVIELVDFSVL